MTRRILSIALSAALFLLAAAPRLLAQTPPPTARPTTTQILTMLTVKADVPRAQVMSVLPEEARDTVKLYLDGKIQQWYSRGDGRGVVFILNAATVEEAKALMDQLPLAKAGLATFEFTTLAPLSPLRILLSQPSAPPKAGQPQ